MLEDHCPQLTGAALTRVASSGTTNAMWRVRNSDASQMVARLPLTDGGIASLNREIALLPLLASTPVADLVRIPTLVESGVDSADRPWALFDWLEGDDAWTLRDDPAANSPEVAVALAGVVWAIRGCSELPAPVRRPGDRGGPLGPLLDRLEAWLSEPRWSAVTLVDVSAVRRVASKCREVVDEPVESAFVHGDLIPGNVLLRDGELSAAIDWGGAGHGDPAQDLGPAWSLFDGSAREGFREAMDVDEASWLRATAFDLEQAVGGVLYYRPRCHVLGDIMQRTLDRILAVH